MCCPRVDLSISLRFMSQAKFRIFVKTAGLRVLGLAWWWRIAVFVALVAVGWQVPGSWKWFPLVLALAAGIWAFVAMVRDVPRVVDRLAGLGGMALDWAGGVLHERWSGWRWVYGGLAAGVLVVAAIQAAPSWHFLATSSLREDETLNVLQYTSRGFARIVSDYSRARNHPLFNLANTALPGADSILPIRARWISFLSVAAGLFLLAGYCARRGHAVAGAVFAGLVMVNHDALKVLLEARGYGMIFLFAVAGCVALAEWLRTGRRVWLLGLAVACVAGSYTLPYFVVFGGGLILAAFAARPTQEVFTAGILSMAAIVMLYLPVAGQLAGTVLDYGENPSRTVLNQFDSLDSLPRTLGFLVPRDVSGLSPAWLFVLLTAAVGIAGFGMRRTRYARLAFGGILACIFGTISFFLFVGEVPMRTGAFLAGPLAFCGALAVGSALRCLPPVAPALQIATAAAGILILWNARPSEPLIPRQNWLHIASSLTEFLPAETRLRVPKSYAKILGAHVRRFASEGFPMESGPVDRGALASGSLAVIDAEFQNFGAGRRPGRKDFPHNVRFVTFPLLINHQRIYFRPPVPSGVLSVSDGSRILPCDVEGWQVPDPALLAHSGGHGETLAAPPGGSAAAPPEISLPATLDIAIEPVPPGSRCNLLFTRGLADLRISAQWRDGDGRLLPTAAPSRKGELASIPIPSEECRSILVEIHAGPDHRNCGRPAFGLLAAWVTPRPQTMKSTR